MGTQFSNNAGFVSYSSAGESGPLWSDHNKISESNWIYSRILYKGSKSDETK
jgi:hypothetical protein